MALLRVAIWPIWLGVVWCASALHAEEAKKLTPGQEYDLRRGAALFTEPGMKCTEDNLATCPGITTEATCGEEQHSDRGGRGLTFGVGHRADSAQDCCDKCKA